MVVELRDSIGFDPVLRLRFAQERRQSDDAFHVRVGKLPRIGGRDDVGAAQLRIAEIAVPTRYFPEASSASFGQSTVYGLKILSLVTKYTLARLGLASGRQFQSLRARYTRVEGHPKP